MSDIVDALTVIAGLVGLWLGTKLTITGAVSIADRFGMSDFAIGIAILSVGSNIPELAITVDAAIINASSGDTSGVVVGTAIGSTLAQIGFVLGLAGLIGRLTIPKDVISGHGIVLLGSIVLLGLVGMDGLVSRAESISLVIVYLVYFAFLLTGRRSSVAVRIDDQPLSGSMASLILLFGIVLVVFSSDITVDAAIRMAGALNINQSLVSIFLLGLGSSLPELSISIGAILKKRTHLSVGNLVGSNIFDTLVLIGVGGAISPLIFDRDILVFDLPALFILSIAVLIFFSRTRGLQKREAAVILGFYLVYAVFRLSTEV